MFLSFSSSQIFTAELVRWRLAENMDYWNNLKTSVSWDVAVITGKTTTQLHLTIGWLRQKHMAIF